MKKLSRFELERLEQYRKLRFGKKMRRKEVQYLETGAKTSLAQLPPVYIKAPSVFSLTKNYEESVRCMKRLKEAVFDKRRVLGRTGAIFLDLATIEELHHAAAIVLAAEMDRWRRVRGIKLKPQSLKDWKPEVLRTAKDLGIFDLLEVNDTNIEILTVDADQEPAGDVALRIVSDNRNDKETTDTLADDLLKRVPQFAGTLTEKDDMALSTALAEASLNSVHHAYEGVRLKYPSDGNRWWAAAVYMENRSIVKFFVYDQGVGIPRTLPKTDFGLALLNKVYGRKHLPPSRIANDSQLIEQALIGGFSGTGKDNRGKGFQQITYSVSRLGGRLRVISGRGMATYQDGTARPEAVNSSHLGGTLLEWTFRVGEM